MMAKAKRIEELSAAYRQGCSIDLTDLIRRELGLDISARYGPFTLKNPFLVAPGQLTVNIGQIAKIKEAGFAGCVLKSFVGEDPSGACSMGFQRARSTYIRTVYDADDTDGSRPIIHWDGRMDTRTLADYLPFARAAFEMSDDRFLVVCSFLCHLPGPDEAFREDEWAHTLGAFYDAGFRLFEIDFCPSLKKESDLIEQANVLRWYRQAPALMKRLRPDIVVYPKLLNLEFGMEFQVQMAREASEGGADGLVVANRFFRHDINCAHGGRTLFERNLRMVQKIRTAVPEIAISATGGVYSGEEAFAYLREGAENVQILSYLMGKVVRPFAIEGNRFQQVFHRLLFDGEDGLLACMLRAGVTGGVE